MDTFKTTIKQQNVCDSTFLTSATLGVRHVNASAKYITMVNNANIT